jgi:hypothetical protein
MVLRKPCGRGEGASRPRVSRDRRGCHPAGGLSGGATLGRLSRPLLRLTLGRATLGDAMPLQGSVLQHEERIMALVPLATKGNYFHVYDFRVKPGRGDDFIDLFNKFDYGDNNPFHRSSAQVKDGVLCRDAADPDHFYLIGEWRDIDEHRRIRELVAHEIRPEFVTLIEGGHFVPNYAEIVSMTPQEVLDKSQQA